MTLRDNAETLDVGANVLAGADARQIVEKAKRMMQQESGRLTRLGMVGQERAYSNIYAFIDKTKYKER